MFNVDTVFAAIATLAKWELIAAGPAATVVGHAVDMPRRPSTRRVWGPRQSIDNTPAPQY